MAIGLGVSLNTVRDVKLAKAVTSGLVLKSNFDTGAVTPISDGSAFFDGVNDYITIADTSELSFGDSSNDSSFSISAWINMTDATDFAIINKGVLNTDGEWNFRTNASDKLVIALYDESVSSCHQSLVSDSAITSYQGSWINVVATYDGSGGALAKNGLTLYLNGAVLASATASLSDYVAMENLSGNVYIGKMSSNYANGNICNVGIWSAVLTPAQIKSIMYKNYSGLTSLETTNLVSWWNLSALHIDGSTVVDNHGSNNGTLS